MTLTASEIRLAVAGLGRRVPRRARRPTPERPQKAVDGRSCVAGGCPAPDGETRLSDSLRVVQADRGLTGGQDRPRVRLLRKCSWQRLAAHLPRDRELGWPVGGQAAEYGMEPMTARRNDGTALLIRLGARRDHLAATLALSRDAPFIARRLGRRGLSRPSMAIVFVSEQYALLWGFVTPLEAVGADRNSATTP